MKLSDELPKEKFNNIELKIDFCDNVTESMKLHIIHWNENYFKEKKGTIKISFEEETEIINQNFSNLF